MQTSPSPFHTRHNYNLFEYAISEPLGLNFINLPFNEINITISISES